MDMAAAVNAGALPVGVLWGFRTAEELQKKRREIPVFCPRRNNGTDRKIKWIRK